MIGQIGTAGGTGYAIEFAGSAIRSLSMEGRMTLCNMAIEAGARAGMVAVDDVTIELPKGRPVSPTGETWDRAVAYWRTLKSDPDAKFDRGGRLDAAEIKPQVTWGTSPEMVMPWSMAVSRIRKRKGCHPARRHGAGAGLHGAASRAWRTTDIKIDKVFIGSCTNSRIEDLRAAAEVVKGAPVAANVQPGDGRSRFRAW